MDAPNNCRGSSENDKHELAIAPVSIPKFIPVAQTTTHDFFFAGAFLTDNAVDSPIIWTNVGAASHSQEILSINLNNPFSPIHAMWLNNDNWKLSTTDSQIFQRYSSAKYLPQGINIYRNLFKYYKVEKSQWIIDFYNVQGYDADNPTVPVTIHSFHQNNETAVPNLSTVDTGAANPVLVAGLMVHPRVGTICGGTPLGSCVVSGYSGLTAETVVFPYPPELRTSFTWNNKCSVASDPAVNTNITYWTTSGGIPANINRMRFFISPYMSATYGNIATVRPMVRIRAKFTITWRDHDATDNIFTNIDRNA